MGLKEEVVEMKNEVKQLEQESLAKELLRGYIHTNIRMFWIWIITFIALVGVACYLIYVKSDIGVSEETIEIDGVEQIDNSHIKIGDDIWEKSE